MNYRPFHLSRIGAAHIRRELPCQDCSSSEIYHDATIAVVADGHGSRRHFRSDRGSAIACRVAIEKIRLLLDEGRQAECFDEERLTFLKQCICDAWYQTVRQDYEENSWTEEELLEVSKTLTSAQLARLIDGVDAPIAYGSTLCAVFARGDHWAAIQLGDGCFCLINENGTYDWPMPVSTINEGNRTASLCMHEPMRDFRHCCGCGTPAGLLVYTDGIEKVFPPAGKEVISLLHWIWRNEYADEATREDNLARTLDTLTARSPIGDDVSIAGLVNPESADVIPIPGRSQKLQELDRLYARLSELDSGTSYHKQQLRQMQQSFGSEETIQQLNAVLRRNQETAIELCKQIAEARKDLDLEPDDSLDRGNLSQSQDFLRDMFDDPDIADVLSLFTTSDADPLIDAELYFDSEQAADGADVSEPDPGAQEKTD